MAKLRKMSMEELHAFRGVLHTVGDVIAAFCCQPRFLREDSNNYNDAGEALEDLLEFVSRYEQALFNVSRAAKPTASREVEWRAWTLLSYEADCADSLSSFAVLASEAARDKADAKSRERYAPKIGGAK
ncbi:MULTISPECIES: hypothetical protein [unclassified Sinorhizobium]|uniref:hypothetical protein n=1 Tax=unclassified Sinorhizobium TaxID=2613772 RepID=UPI0024C2C67C|nr:MULTISPECIES: hypothetical protein [unclassified Sinorhizobium]MDK1377119.1 hypothetical protein [Sinorhizobium sp. 6-70]MDK1479586.1 hypothetical protein [Sinorhizobium sp. 6-117]